MKENDSYSSFRHAIKKPKKIHTSIYLLPRHRKHLEFLINARGTSMTEVIAFLIDQSIRSYKS